jgi:aspartate dehydrogenase
MSLDIALVGCGAIGRAVVDGAQDIDGVGTIHLHDQDPHRVADLADAPDATAAEDLEAALEAADVAVEAASQAAVEEVGEAALRHGCDLVVVSTGALADEDLRDRLAEAASEEGRRVYCPSGALPSLDAVRAASEAELEAVELETRKPLEALPPEDVAEASKTEPTTLFRGPAREAVQEFPKNVNVAAALSLNGVGVDETTVTIVADPDLDRNQHTVRAQGAFGELEARVRNDPSPDNPATSYLAPLSVLALLRRLTQPIWVG